MQFRVIAEASANSKPPSDDAWEELERYLNTAKIPARLIRQLQPGKPRVIKNELSYEQALTLSDRLMDLGLESTIEPPVKPEAVEISPRSEATATGVQQQLLAATANDGRELAGKATRANIHRSAKRISSPVSLVATGGKVKPRASITRRPTNTAPNHLSGTRQTPTVLAEAAAKVRSLFRLPKGGKLQIDLPRMSQARLWNSTALSLLAPALIIITCSALVVATIALASGLYALLAGFSVLLAILVTPLAALAAATAAILFALPFWPTATKDRDCIAIKPKDEPKLTMLTTAICKIIGAPAPSTIYLTSEPQVRGGLNCSTKEFLSFRQPLTGETALFLGTPVLAFLSIHDLAALIARECGRFAEPRFRRCYRLSLQVLAWLEACRRRNRLSQQLRALSNSKHLAPTLRWIERIQAPSYWIIGIAERGLLLLLDRTDAVSRRYQIAVSGDEDPARLRQIMADTKAAHRDAISSMLGNAAPQYLVDSLAVLGRELQKTNKVVADQPHAQTGIVRSAEPVTALLFHFNEYDKQLTRRFYAAKGLNVEALDLMPLAEMRRREANEEKLRKIAHHYYGKWFHNLQPWQLPGDGLASEAEKKILVKRLNHCIGRIRYLSPDRPQLIVKYYKLFKHLTELKAAKKVIAAGVPFKFQYCADASDDLDKQIAIRAAKLREYGEELRQQNAVMGERLALGLALDAQHRSTVKKIYTTLNAFHQTSDKLNQLTVDLEELSTLQSYRFKKSPQHYQLHMKELNERVEASCKLIRRKLQHCPYDFYDRRYPTLGTLLDSRLEQHAAGASVDKAATLLAVVTQAYRGTSDLAASYATRMERAFRVETVKRV